MKNNKGSILIYALFIMLFLGTAGAAVLTAAYNGAKQSAFTEDYEKRYYEAESSAVLAAHRFIYELQDKSFEDWDGENLVRFFDNNVIDGIYEDDVPSLKIDIINYEDGLSFTVMAASGDGTDGGRIAEVTLKCIVSHNPLRITIIERSIRERTMTKAVPAP